MAASRRGFFITGTDTEVGKTAVTAALASVLRAAGYDVGVMKPVQTGCRRSGSRLIAQDAERLRRAASTRDPIDLVAPYRYREPLAPLAAARLTKQPIDLNRLMRAYRALVQRHRVLLVEGSGGLLVPLTRRVSMADLARRFRLPLIIVARAGLGTINQTLLTVEAARRRGLTVAGVVLNRPRPVADDRSVATNARLLRELGGVEVIGPLRHVPFVHQRRPAHLWRRWLETPSRQTRGSLRRMLRRGDVVLATRR